MFRIASSSPPLTLSRSFALWVGTDPQVPSDICNTHVLSLPTYLLQSPDWCSSELCLWFLIALSVNGWRVLVIFMCLLIMVVSLCGLFIAFAVCWKGFLPDNINEPGALNFLMPLCFIFSSIIEGSDDKAIPISCWEQKIELMEALDKKYCGFR